MIECDEATLKKLLKEIDGREWGCNDGDGSSIAFQAGAKVFGVSGGMGGGEVTDDLWVHGTLKDLEPAIREVLSGKKASIKN